MRYFYGVYSLLSLIMAQQVFTLGLDWMNEDIGHGLNPIIAFPLGTILVVLCLGCGTYAIRLAQRGHRA